MASFISACCNRAPAKAEYTPIGTMTQDASGMAYYISGSAKAKRGVVFLYDVFGLHPNAYQVADALALEGLRVVIPDVLEGKPLTSADMKQEAVLKDFKARRGTYAYCRPMIKAAIDVLRAEGCENIGAIGLCWGAKLAMCALGDQDGICVDSGVMLHPSMLELADFERAQGPILLLLSKDEADFTDMFAVASAKPFGAHSYMERFSKQAHGFCGARGDFANPEVVCDVNRALALTIAFFKTGSVTQLENPTAV
ncbi:hypothetical protein H4R26_004691 [Coemansia thaxteri]|uniref:Dienelactone hydrolase domain-containing protein n=1 Tax=Coemansia thaxteri TaxID=2663907 RepID=A0A9W8EDC9_9FUNG|nr:hypothetical protein H4R26_004691 [Coemansia thaxteri]KAJ2473654.1 hypothetical protein EV174_005689 [Coemansia sp. RSA 2320]